jgi:AraC-like DNA-binding protein
MKILPFIIPKQQEESLVYKEDREKFFYNRLHQHEEIQISYIKNGEGSIIVLDKISNFEKGDLLVIGSNLPHVFRSEIHEEEFSIMQSLFFTYTSFGKDFFDLDIFNDLDSFFETSKQGIIIKNASKKIINYFEKLNESNPIKRFILLLKIMNEISLSDKIPLSTYIYDKKTSVDEGKKMQLIYEYVMNNFNKKITLQEIASISNMTKNAFCKYYKLRTNKSFFEFLIEFRVERASKLLIKNKQLSVVEVSELCGFTSISNFNRRFKEIKEVSPLRYRILYS